MLRRDSDNNVPRQGLFGPIDKVDVLVPGTHRTPTGPLEVGNGDFAREVVKRIPEDAVYRKPTREPVRIVGIPGHQEMQDLSREAVQKIIDDSVRLVRQVARSRENPDDIRQQFVNASLNMASCVRDEIRACDRIRIIRRFVRYPVYVPGWCRSAAGYNVGGTFYDEPPELAGLVPETDTETIREVLDDLVVDFPFLDDGRDNGDASRANFYGLLLTPLVRPLIDGNVPLHVVNAKQPRTGKTKLVEDVLGGVVLGEPTPALQLTDTEEERNKRIMGLLGEGGTIVHLDNLTEHFNSPALASLITSTTFQGRILGTSEVRRVRNTLMLVATGNNLTFSGEMAKRAIPINLKSLTGEPEYRTRFHHPDLRGYVRERRRLTLACLMGMVQNWISAGCPDGPKIGGFGGFEGWLNVLSGILTHAGYGDVWLKNVSDWRKHADPFDRDTRRLITKWIETGRQPRRTGELLGWADEEGLFSNEINGGSPPARRASFAKSVLHQILDRPYGNFQINRSESGNNSLYYLNETNALFESEGGDDD